MRKFLFLLSLAILPFAMFAQYSISGKVTSHDNGNPLPGAHIIVMNTIYSTATDELGNYSITNLKVGDYQIKITYVGFETQIVDISVNDNITENITLVPANIFSEEVIITAIRANDESPTTYTVMNQTQIAKRNMGKDLPYIFKTTPSLVVSSDAGAGVGYTGMRIRGTDLTGINVTLNGVPVNDAESHNVFFVDLPDLASSINDVQIQRGVGTSTNGAASFGASININTGENNIDPFAEISSAYGSFNTFKNTVSFGSGLLKNSWNFSGRLSSITSDGYIDRASSDLQSAYLSGSYIGEKDILKAVIILGKEKTYQAWYGVPKDSLKTNRTYNPAGEMYDNDGNFLGYYNNQTDNYKQNYYQLHYAHKFNDKLNLATTGFLTTGKGYYESYRNQDDYADYGIMDTIIGNDTISSSNLIRQKWLDNKYYGLNLALNYSAERINLNFGGGWNRYEGDHFGKIIWAQVIPINWLDRNWYFNTGTKTDFNFFAKANYSLTEKINLYGDLQYRSIDYKIVGTHDDLGDLTQNHTYNFFNPKAGIFYKLNEKHDLYFSFGIANREPNRSVYRDADPNQEIKPEMLMDYELGYKLLNDKFLFEANLFYMDYKDQFVHTGKINNVGAAIMTNVPDSYRAGIELVTSIGITKWLDWNANATFSQNKIKNFTAYIDDWTTWAQREEVIGTTDISFSPNTIISSDFVFKPTNGLSVSLLTKYVGKQYIDNTSNDNRSIDPYLVNNININYSIRTNFIKQIDFILSLNNILNEKYETNAWVYRYYYEDVEYDMNGYFPQAEFNFMVGVNLKF